MRLVQTERVKFSGKNSRIQHVCSQPILDEIKVWGLSIIILMKNEPFFL